MTQIQLVQRIVDLVAKNPNAEIKICVDGEIAAEFGWTAHKIIRVETSVWIEIRERIFTDESSAKDEIASMLSDVGLNTAEFAASVDEYFNQYAMNAICIYTSAA